MERRPGRLPRLCDFLDTKVGHLEVVSVDNAKGYPEVGVVLPDGSVGVRDGDPQLHSRVQTFLLGKPGQEPVGGE